MANKQRHKLAPHFTSDVSKVPYFQTIDTRIKTMTGNTVSAIPLGSFLANDINGNGVMVGEDTGRAAMARFINGTLQVQWLSNELNTTATAISPSGDWVVGEVSTLNGDHWLGEAFVWTETTGLLLLGTLENYGSSYQPA